MVRITQTSGSLPTRLRTRLNERLAPKRMAHVMGVEGLSVSLANRWGIDPGPVLIAALLHDIAKEDPRETQRCLAEENGVVPLSDEDERFPAMWHAMAAARIGRDEFDVTDPAILEAFAWHTTGNARLGIVGVALYVADFLEPTRHFEGVERYRREILPLPPREAALRVATLRLQNIRNLNRPTHSRTVGMKEWLENHPDLFHEFNQEVSSTS